MRTLLIALALLAGVPSSIAGAAAIQSWMSSGDGSVTIDALAPNHVRVLWEQVGTGGPDDTTEIDTPDGLEHHSSGYSRVDLKPFGVPADAKAATLTFKALFTKGNEDGTVSVYAFARRPGADCCYGPPGHRNFPVDTHYDVPIEGMVVQTAAQLARDADRTWSPSYQVPLDNGTFEFSWGYRRMPGLWPQGDAVGIGVYLNGWVS